MKNSTKRKFIKPISVILIGAMVVEMFFPLSAYALTSGPSQPEFSSFEPVATNSMVNEFTGDFVYNLPVLEIPGAHGGGYAMSLSYHAGTSPEEEASWVGHGWTLNPGAINRSKRGFADDIEEGNVKYYNKTPANWTVGVGGGLGLEFFSNDALNINGMLRYNNFRGYSLVTGISLVSGPFSMGSTWTNGVHEGFSLSYNILDEVTDQIKKEIKETPKSQKDSDKQKLKALYKSLRKEAQKAQFNAGVNALVSSIFQSYRPKNTTVSPTIGADFNLQIAATLGIPSVNVGLEGKLKGMFAYQQAQNPIYNKTYTGYMYSYKGLNNKDLVMDYTNERETSFQRKDLYLSIPYANFDYYSTTGEGMQGSFRLHNKQIGSFRPTKTESNSLSFFGGGGVDLSVAVGAGPDWSVGAGFAKMKMDGWDAGDFETVNFANPDDDEIDEPVFFRFTNDLGGYVYRGSTSVAYKAHNNSLSPIEFPRTINFGERAGRAGYIGYTTNQKMMTQANGNYVEAYNLNPQSRGFVNRTTNNTAFNKSIGEFVTYNESGICYTYGLPVYNRNEGRISFGLNGQNNVNVDNKYRVHANLNTSNASTIIGEEVADAYASTYLITSITTPDYLDKTLNGPTDDDYGGWTRFAYKQKYGTPVKNGASTNTNWYRWRMPYTGFYYDRGEFTDVKDDKASFTFGEKEIYYLDSIVTRTHVAIFYRSPRSDGLDAAIEAQACNNPAAKGNKGLEKLDKIVLYAKSDMTQPIKTVHFDYDYSIFPNTPNTVGTGGNTGKLTLKRVWFEYNKAINAKISPYIFQYTYPTHSLPSPYTNLQMPSILAQNPDFTHYLDAWGNYQKNGAQRFFHMRPGLTQTPDADFDPAAWQLKSITLPSGGEIQVQYESDDYLYVQDKNAMKLVRLTGMEGEDKFYLNLDDIGEQPSQQVADALNTILMKIPIGEQEPEKVYFKFLYALLGTNADLDNCSSDYLKGYAGIQGVGYDANVNKVFIKFEGVGSNDFKNPRKACKDWFRAEKAGNINDNGSCTPPAIAQSQPSSIGSISIDDAIKSAKALYDDLDHIKGILNGIGGNCCKVMNYDYSYIRIPTLKPKLGGGLRVKRLLMYDKGIEPGEVAQGGVVYGSEYFYTDENGKSSGVATYEPNDMREENPMVGFLMGGQFNLFQRLALGRDRKSMEGPLGEMTMPGPAVGYGRVTVKSIHSGHTAPPYSVKTYHTAKNFPIKVDVTDLDKSGCLSVPIPLGIININIESCKTWQGFNFEFNSMHGQIQSAVTKSNTGALISSEEYAYYMPGEQLPVMTSPYSMYYMPLGVETELAMEHKVIRQESVTSTVENDIVAGVIPPFFIPLGSISLGLSLDINDATYKSHTTNKITTYPAIVKSVTSMADGIAKRVSNLAFDPLSGQPLLTETEDGFNTLELNGSNTGHKGVYSSFSFPASQHYDAFKQKAKTQGLRLPLAGVTADIITGTNGHYVNFTAIPGSNTNICQTLGNVSEGGDLVQLYNSSGAAVGFYHLGAKTDEGVEILPSRWSSSALSNMQGVSFRIVKSGMNNQLDNMVGSLVTYGMQNVATTLTAQTFQVRQNFANLINNTLSGLASCTPSSTNPCRTWISLPINPASYPNYPGIDTLMACETCPTNAPNPRIEVGDLGDSVYIACVREASLNQVYCKATFPKVNGVAGYFGLNENGMLSYFLPGKPCDPIVSSCLQFCRTLNYNLKVLDASAVELSDDWTYDALLWNASNSPSMATWNKYDKGEKGKWRVKSSYKYKTEIVEGSNEYGTGDARIYKNAGVYKDFSMFDWRHPEYNSPKWKKVSTVLRYSPHGEALEEQDILGIFSTAKTGYKHTLPYLVAKNADYESVQFEGFENVYDNAYLEDLLPIPNINWVVSTDKHSGILALNLPANNAFEMKATPYSTHIAQQGLSIKYWSKDNYGANAAIIKVKELSNNTTVNLTASKIARNGEWTLYEAKLSPNAFSNNPTAVKVSFTNTGTTALMLDDVRIQPMDAQVTAYVYDVRTLRLLTSFDDQHFGLYYQYDGEGKLVRKLVETEKGMKTIQESQYNVPKQGGRLF